MSPSIVDEKQAREIAENFLRQNYSIVKIDTPVMQGGEWIVSVYVSEPKNRKFQVKVNARSGEVSGWN